MIETLFKPELARSYIDSHIDRNFVASGGHSLISNGDLSGLIENVALSTAHSTIHRSGNLDALMLGLQSSLDSGVDSGGNLALLDLNAHLLPITSAASLTFL